jgi:hypothetical protein
VKEVRDRRLQMCDFMYMKCTWQAKSYRNRVDLWLSGVGVEGREE